MDSQPTVPSMQAIPQTSLSQSPNFPALLKSIYNSRMNRKMFLAGITLYQAIYFIILNFFISWKDPLVDSFYFPVFYSVTYMIYMLFYIRRLHDINRSGLWVLLILIPRILAHIPGIYITLIIPRLIIEYAFTLFLLIRKGDGFTNDYGQQPRRFF